MPSETLRLEHRVPGAALHPMLEKAVGVAHAPHPKDERFADNPPDLEVLQRLASGLRALREQS